MTVKTPHANMPCRVVPSLPTFNSIEFFIFLYAYRLSMSTKQKASLIQIVQNIMQKENACS